MAAAKAAGLAREKVMEQLGEILLRVDAGQFQPRENASADYDGHLKNWVETIHHNFVRHHPDEQMKAVAENKQPMRDFGGFRSETERNVREQAEFALHIVTRVAAEADATYNILLGAVSCRTYCNTLFGPRGRRPPEDSAGGRDQIRAYLTDGNKSAAVRDALIKSLSRLGHYYCTAVHQTSQEGNRKDKVYEDSSKLLRDLKEPVLKRAVEIVWLMWTVFDRVLYEEFPFDWFFARHTVDILPLVKQFDLPKVLALQKLALGGFKLKTGTDADQGFLRADKMFTSPTDGEKGRGKRTWTSEQNVQFETTHSGVEAIVYFFEFYGTAVVDENSNFPKAEDRVVWLPFGRSRIVAKNLLGWRGGEMLDEDYSVSLSEDYEADLKKFLALTTFNANVDKAYLAVAEGVANRPMLDEYQRRVVEALRSSQYYAEMHDRLATVEELRIRYHHYVRSLKRVSLLRSIVSTRCFLHYLTHDHQADKAHASPKPPTGTIKHEHLAAFVELHGKPYKQTADFITAMTELYSSLNAALDGGAPAFAEVEKLKHRDGLQVTGNVPFSITVDNKQLIPDLNQEGQQQVVRVYEAGSIPLCMYKPHLPAERELIMTPSVGDESELTTVVSEIMHLLVLSANDNILHNYKQRDNVHAIPEANDINALQCQRWTDAVQQAQPTEGRLKTQVTQLFAANKNTSKKDTYLLPRHPQQIVPVVYQLPPMPATPEQLVPANGTNGVDAEANEPQASNGLPPLEQVSDDDGPAALPPYHVNATPQNVKSKKPPSKPAAPVEQLLDPDPLSAADAPPNGHPDAPIAAANPAAFHQPVVPALPRVADIAPVQSRTIIHRLLEGLRRKAVEADREAVFNRWMKAALQHLSHDAAAINLSVDLRNAIQLHHEWVTTELRSARDVFYESRTHFHMAIGAMSCRSFMEKTPNLTPEKDDPDKESTWLKNVRQLPARLRGPFQDSMWRVGHEFFSRIKRAPRPEDPEVTRTAPYVYPPELLVSAVDRTLADSFLNEEQPAPTAEYATEVIKVVWRKLNGYNHGNVADGINELFPRGHVNYHPLILKGWISGIDAMHLEALALLTHTEVLDCLKGNPYGYYKVGAPQMLEQRSALNPLLEDILMEFKGSTPTTDHDLVLFTAMFNEAIKLSPGRPIQVDDIKTMVSAVRDIDLGFAGILEQKDVFGAAVYEEMATVQQRIVEHVQRFHGAAHRRLREFYLLVREWYCFSVRYIEQLETVACAHAVLSTRTFVERLIEEPLIVPVQLELPVNRPPADDFRTGESVRIRIDYWHKYNKTAIGNVATRLKVLGSVVENITATDFPQKLNTLYKLLCDIIHSRDQIISVKSLRALHVHVADRASRKLEIFWESEILRVYEARYLRATLYLMPNKHAACPPSHPLYLREGSSARDLIAEAVHYMYLAFAHDTKVHSYHHPLMAHTLVYRDGSHGSDPSWAKEEFKFKHGYAEMCCTWREFLNSKCEKRDLFTRNKIDTDAPGTLPQALVSATPVDDLVQSFTLSRRDFLLFTPAYGPKNIHDKKGLHIEKKLSDIGVNNDALLYF